MVNPCFTGDLIKMGISESKITYIPNYVSGDNFKIISEKEIEEVKKKYGIPLNKFVVLGCGQIQTRKGIDDFVETAKRNPDMFFVWVGGFSFGRLMHGYRKYKKMLKNLPQNMINISIIDREYMNDIYNACDVLFMPSHMELFPMTILEASKVYKPILVKSLDLYEPILFNKAAKGNNVDEYSVELNMLKNDLTYYKEYSDNSKFISDFYNEEMVKNMWKEYYQRIYLKWKSKKNIK